MYKHFTALNENESNNISPPEDVSDNPSNISKDDDFKFNYVCNVLREGLMDWNREDASKEPSTANDFGQPGYPHGTR
jgi:hypothetical protein